MALDALFHQTDAGINAVDMRRILNAFAGGRTGILNYGDFLGSATGVSTFTVAAGLGIVGHSTSSIERFLISNSSTVTLTGLTAPGSGTNYITVYARLQDATLGDQSTNAVTIATSTTTNGTFGIPAGQSGIELYRITLPSGQTLLSGATITNMRAYAKPWNVPWGVVGRGVRTSDWGPHAQATSVEVVAFNATIVASRLYRLTLGGRIYTTTSDRVVIRVTGYQNSPSYIRIVDTMFHNDATDTVTNLAESITTTATQLGGAGSRTFYLTAGNVSPTNNTLYFYAGDDAGGIPPTSITLEDIGPDSGF